MASLLAKGEWGYKPETLVLTSGCASGCIGRVTGDLTYSLKPFLDVNLLIKCKASIKWKTQSLQLLMKS